jgi:hypothetical protein
MCAAAFPPTQMLGVGTPRNNVCVLAAASAVTDTTYMFPCLQVSLTGSFRCPADRGDVAS